MIIVTIFHAIRKTNKKVTTTRNRIVSKSFPLKDFSPDNVKLIFTKYWSDVESIKEGETNNNNETVLREPKVILDEMKALDNESEAILKTIRELV